VDALALSRVLFVEDDSDIQSIVRFALVRVGGLLLETCRTGAEAILVAPRFEPELLLLDVMLPGLDGPSTLRALREFPCLGGTPAIFLTARALTHEVAAYRAPGVIAVVTKPFEPSGLAARIRKLWNDHHGLPPA
jgi:CheY-like chemotaxis protein